MKWMISGEEDGFMKYRNLSHRTTLLALIVLASMGSGALAQVEYKAPDAGIPELFTLMGEFVRIAYNNEGYVSLGYRQANRSAGDEFMLLEIGATVRDGVDAYDLKREHLSIDTPDGKTIPLATVQEYHAGNLQALERAANAIRDSINYFPPKATRACRIGFFAPLTSRALAYDQVELSDRNACVGRLFFKVPGGIQYGQQWLNVQFKDSLVKVPFRNYTEEEEKKFRGSWKDIKKEHEKRFKK